MVHVCTFPVEMPSIENHFQLLGKCSDNRWYYISKNYLTEFFKVSGEPGVYDIFLKELSLGKLTIMETASAWLGVNEKAVINLTMEEMDFFIELVKISGETYVFENLMEVKIDDVSIGQQVFINSLADIIRRFRDGR